MHRILTFLLLLAAAGAAAQPTSKVTLEAGEPMFAVMTAINVCGYDQELNVSAPLRARVREEVAAAVRESKVAGEAAANLCAFYRDHKQSTPAADLAQYVSLAINLQASPTSASAPKFATAVPEADLPPDASYVLGLLPLLEHFYDAAGVHKIWLKHRPEYDALIESFHDPIANLLTATDVYLKMPINGYAGRLFTIHIEPMAAPGQVNARNYGENYFLAFAPDHGQAPLPQIRHTYLHFVLDPLAAKHGTELKRLDPLMDGLRAAPMDAAYKQDKGLLVNECLIRAIEARLQAKAKEDESARRQQVERAAAEGFILTPFFYEQLIEFEKTPQSLRDAYPDFLHNLDVDRERKRLKSIAFASQSAPEMVQASKPKQNVVGAPGQLDQAELSLESGDIDRAQQLAQQVLDQKDQKAGQQEDPGRAWLILGKVAAKKKDMAGAQADFAQALSTAKDPGVLGWAHIYLGRIYDLKDHRNQAVEQYQKAITPDALPDVRAAGYRGIERPYEPPAGAHTESDSTEQQQE